MTKNQKVSSKLSALVKRYQDKKTITFGQLINALGEQAFGIIMILFALPSALPISFIPGVSFVFGLPIVLVALHLIIARKTLWLPKYLAKKAVSVVTLQTVLQKTKGSLKWIERFLKPRALFLINPKIDRVHGLVLLILSLLLLLPIPFSNMILSVLIILFGLGLAVRDGYAIIIAYLGSVLYFILLGFTGQQIFKLFS